MSMPENKDQAPAAARATEGSLVMRRNCVECRHWELVVDPDIEVAETQCSRGYFHSQLESTAAIRKLLRTATDCGDYEAVEPEMADCTCRLGATSGRVPDPRCPLHGQGGERFDAEGHLLEGER